MTAYLVGGAVLFSVWEGWELLDSFYFCFISLALIGFGDLLPAAVEERMITCSCYLLFGMSVVAMCFQLGQEDVVNSVRRLFKRLLSYLRSDDKILDSGSDTATLEQKEITQPLLTSTCTPARLVTSNDIAVDGTSSAIVRRLKPSDSLESANLKRWTGSSIEGTVAQRLMTTVSLEGAIARRLITPASASPLRRNGPGRIVLGSASSTSSMVLPPFYHRSAFAQVAPSLQRKITDYGSYTTMTTGSDETLKDMSWAKRTHNRSIRW